MLSALCQHKKKKRKTCIKNKIRLGMKRKGETQRTFSPSTIINNKKKREYSILIYAVDADMQFSIAYINELIT